MPRQGHKDKRDIKDEEAPISTVSFVSLTSLTSFVSLLSLSGRLPSFRAQVSNVATTGAWSLVPTSASTLQETGFSDALARM